MYNNSNRCAFGNSLTMNEFLLNIAINHQYIIYLAVLVIAIIEGPIISVFAGILLHLGYVQFALILITIMSGDLIGDVVWYMLGNTYGHRFIYRFGKYFKITESSVAYIVNIFHTHRNKILVGSKLTTGFGFAPVVLFAAGMSRVPFKNYMLANTFGQIIWSGLLLGTGYHFSKFYSFLDTGFKKVFFISGIIICTVLLVRLVSYIRDNKLPKNL